MCADQSVVSGVSQTGVRTWLCHYRLRDLAVGKAVLTKPQFAGPGKGATPTHLHSSPGAWGRGPATPRSPAAGLACSSMTPSSSGSSCWRNEEKTYTSPMGSTHPPVLCSAQSIPNTPACSSSLGP